MPELPEVETTRRGLEQLDVKRAQSFLLLRPCSVPIQKFSSLFPDLVQKLWCLFIFYFTVCAKISD